MGILNKIMFWKKDEDEFTLDEPDTEEVGPPKDAVPPPPGPSGSDPIVQPIKEATPPPALSPSADMQPSHSGKSLEKDVQIMQAKLDSINAKLDAVLSRIERIESKRI
ncbi:hypothetical protein GF342_03825 [Candidatus Woesearchaeota archaeon]|nr:hypothetical protein [Candidatus Woesearchaeota archaeon]